MDQTFTQAAAAKPGHFTQEIVRRASLALSSPTGLAPAAALAAGLLNAHTHTHAHLGMHTTTAPAPQQRLRLSKY